MELRDYPRPERDNGRGLHWSASIYHPTEVAEWMIRLRTMNIRWLKVLDDGGGSSLRLCARLLDDGIMPIVRLYRDKQNPGHVGHAEERTMRALVKLGVRYIETNNEPDLQVEWSIPRPLKWLEIVAKDWLYDASKCLDAGALPAVPALSVGRQDDIIAAIIEQGGRDALVAGAWAALHNYGLNHPLDYPDDDVNQRGTPLTSAAYAADGDWAWDNLPLDAINTWRWQDKNPGATINEDPACFRSFEFLNNQIVRALGFSLPILTTEGGVVMGWREDRRYARINPRLHLERTVAMFAYMQSSAPPYYFVMCPWLIANFELGHFAPGWESQSWFTNWWNGQFGLNGRLPTVAAVANMHSLSRLERQGPHHSVVQGDIEAMRGVGGLRVILRSEGFSAAADTSADGRFRFAGLAPGVYTLQAGGLIKAGLRLDGTNSLTFPSLRPPPPVAPDLEWDRRLSDIRVSVQPAQAAEGEPIWKLVRASLLDRSQTGVVGIVYYDVLDELGRPLTGQEVAISWPTGIGRKSTEQREAPGHGADFPLSSVFNPEDEQGPYTAWVAGLPSERVAGLGLPVGLAVGFVLVFQRAPAAGARGSAVEGTISQGALRTVAVHLADGSRQTTRTDTAGRYSFSALPPGLYDLELVDHGMVARAIALDGANLVVCDYALPSQSSAIYGRLIGGQAGMEVFLRATGGEERRTTANELGHWAFQLLPAGVYTITVAGHTAASITVDGVNSIEAPPIDVRVRQSTVAGVVRATSGPPLPDVTVTLSAPDENTSPVHETSTSADGGFEFGGLAAGAYIVRAGDRSLPVNVGERARTVVELTLAVEPPPSVFALAVLFGPMQSMGARVNLRLARRYLRAFAPAVTFRLEEAIQARQVLIVGDLQAVTESDESRLRAAGCTVARVGGTPYAVEDGLQRLTAANTPLPADRAIPPPRGRRGPR